jgi:hypothetical protein
MKYVLRRMTSGAKDCGMKKTKVFTVRMDGGLFDAVRRASRREQRSMGDFARLILERDNRVTKARKTTKGE